MGLFESKAEKEARIAAANQAKEQQKEAFKNSEIMKFILGAMQSEENDWLTSRQNYYDCGKRIVYVFPDQFSIDWRESKMVQVQTEQGLRERYESETVKSFDFAYTTLGYVPVDKDALKTWTEVVLEQLKAVLPNVDFDYIKTAEGKTIRNENCDGYRFTYTLSPIHYKSWY